MKLAPLLLTAVSLTAPVAAAAQSGAVPVTSDTVSSKPVAGDDDLSRVDIVDVIRKFFKRSTTTADRADQQRTTLVIVPIIGAQPKVGFKAGAGALIEFPLGPADSTRFSSVMSSLTFSTEKQLGVSLNPTIYGPGNAWKLKGRNSFNAKNADDVTLGTSSDLSGDSLDYQSTAFADTFYVRAWRQLYFGGGIIYAGQHKIEPGGSSGVPSPFESYSATNGFALQQQSSGGSTVALEFDDRDNQNDAISGWLVAAQFHDYFDGFLGGDSRWREVFAEARTYRPLTVDKRHKLAFWAYGNFVTDGVAPYLSLPMSAGDPDGRSDRGYAEGRFRGEQMLYSEVEYRGLVTANGLIGLVSFVNVSTLSNKETGERLFHSVAVGGGGGVRVLFSKRSRANICFDVGFGRSGSHGIYVGMNDVF
jgi:hypothetical protein